MCAVLLSTHRTSIQCVGFFLSFLIGTFGPDKSNYLLVQWWALVLIAIVNLFIEMAARLVKSTDCYPSPSVYVSRINVYVLISPGIRWCLFLFLKFFFVYLPPPHFVICCVFIGGRSCAFAIDKIDAWTERCCIHPRIQSCVTTPVLWTIHLSWDAARTTTCATVIWSPYCTSTTTQVNFA